MQPSLVIRSIPPGRYNTKGAQAVFAWECPRCGLTVTAYAPETETEIRRDPICCYCRGWKPGVKSDLRALQDWNEGKKK